LSFYLFQSRESLVFSNQGADVSESDTFDEKELNGNRREAQPNPANWGLGTQTQRKRHLMAKHDNKLHRVLPLLESGEGSDGWRWSQSTFNDEVSIEKGDMARGDEGGSSLIGPMPKLNANAAQDVGGRGAAGAASFSEWAMKIM